MQQDDRGGWRIREAAGGFDFPEGPAVAPDGTVFLVNVRSDVVSRVTPDGAVSVFARVPGRGNGACLDPDGSLWVCDVAARALVRVTPDGKATTAADRWRDRPFNGPNDCCLDGAGSVFFTDPDGSSLEKRIGAVFRRTPSGEVLRLATGLAYPNGLVLEPDEGGLLVAETLTNRILRLDPRDGEDQEAKPWTELPDDPGPDGMRFGPDGRLYVAHYGAGTIDVFTPAGKLDEGIRLPGRNPTNLCFTPDGARFYVTEAENGVLLEISRD